jgi:hypothetical protein
MSKNKIHLKRLKRKEKLEARFKCHGNKFHCEIEHPLRMPVKPEIKVPEIKPEIKVEKLTWWQKIWKFLGIFKQP